jgi:hypothetical protein
MLEDHSQRGTRERTKRELALCCAGNVPASSAWDELGKRLVFSNLRRKKASTVTRKGAVTADFCSRRRAMGRKRRRRAGESKPTIAARQPCRRNTTPLLMEAKVTTGVVLAVYRLNLREIGVALAPVLG